MSQSRPNISIIVPVYNMEKTLCRCLDSILSQDYTNFEVILINDGSNDSTPTICERYAQKFNRINYITRENRGLSLTLKEGVEQSRGSFILFIDSDDYVEPKILSTLVAEQMRVDADIVQCGINFIRVDGSLKGQKRMGNRMIDCKESLFEAYFIEMSMNNTLAAALFRKELFENIFFPEGALSIDLQVMPYVLNNCHVYKQVDLQLYNAVQYPNSVSRGGYSEQMYKDKMIGNIILDGFFEKYAPNLKDYMYYRKSTIAASMFYKIYKSKHKVLDKDIKQKELKSIFASSYRLFRNSSYYERFSWKDKLKLKLFEIHPWLYIEFIDIYSKLVNIHIK